ncbi:MAG: hypothetical protein WBW48_03590, partial [Anaerolineae bacterium]
MLTESRRWGLTLKCSRRTIYELGALSDESASKKHYCGENLARFLERPSLAYQCALGLCAVEVHRSGGPVAVLASGPFYAREVLKRLSGEVVLCPVGGWGPQISDCWAEVGPEVSWDHVTLAGNDDASALCRTAIWVEPQENNVSDARTCLANISKEGARLIVITSNGLRFVLPEWKGADRLPACPPLGWAKTVRFLQRWGFRTQHCYGLQGPLSLAYGFLARLAATVGR